MTPLPLVILGLLFPQMSVAQTVLPQGGSVVQGDVTISSPSTGQMLLNQGSDRAIVNWDGFSIGWGGVVDIRQPGTTSAILNRVTGGAASQIHGRLSATGQVFVVNRNGLFIGPQGEVIAGGGFVGSTLDTRDDDFMAGRLRFEGLGRSAEVSNAGSLTIGRGGFAALLGGRVSNSGRVMVPMGRIGLGAGERATLDLSGDQFLQVMVPSTSDDDETRALIENAGTVSAEGGVIEMRAATARDAARHAINLSGVAEARSVSVRGGTITLGGGPGGRVTVSGRVSTRARAPERAAIVVEESRRPVARRGGDVTIMARKIDLDGARIDASGVNGGGLIRIGGDYQGSVEMPTALYLGVDADTRIRADAGRTGDGGRVILWSDLDTSFAGQISARGGARSGDGGFVEVSGKEMLSFNGMVDTRAPMGTVGTLLLDPRNIFIQETGTTTGGFDIDQFFPSQDDSVLLVSDLEANLAFGNLLVSTGSIGAQDGNITVNAQVDWATNSTLGLTAANDIRLNAGMNGPSGALEINAGGEITTSAAGTINVNRFELQTGNWNQVLDPLPAFSANAFLAEWDLGTSFLRARSGNGTLGAPYEVMDIYGFQGIGSPALLDQNFILGSNIPAADANGFFDADEGTGFLPIGRLSVTGFSGTLDGRGNTISGLTVSREDGAGVFDQTQGATISNVTLDGLVLQSEGSLGGLVNLAIDTVIDNVQVSGALVTDFFDNMGGLVGELRNATSVIRNSSFTGTISTSIADNDTVNVGGLAGANRDGTITGSTANATISFNDDSLGSWRLGGAVGLNEGIVNDVTTTGSIEAIDVDGTIFAGGIAGINDSDEGITGSTAGMSVTIEAFGSETILAGGAVGSNIGTMTETQATGAVDVTSGGGIVFAGGLAGFNNNMDGREVSEVSATGDVDVTNSAAEGSGFGGSVGGAIGRNSSTISDATATGNVTVNASLTQLGVGGFVGLNDFPGEVSPGGDISASSATGAVSLTTDVEGEVGGFAGGNGGQITDAFAEGAVIFRMPSYLGNSEDRLIDSSAGGFAGTNEGTSTRTAARGNVSSETSEGIVGVGGHTGSHDGGTTIDAYATGDVSSASDATQYVGGLVGVALDGALTNTFASGVVSASGSGTAFTGGLAGFFEEESGFVTTSVSGSYWDTETTGRADPGRLEEGEGLSTADFEDTAGFLARASSEDWDFDAVWAPGAAGRYPSIYTIDRVVFARPDPLDLTYGGTISATGSGRVTGGPDVYVFAAPGEDLDTTPIFDTLTFPNRNVGSRSFTLDTTPLTSTEGETYAVVALPGRVDISPAPLELTPDDLTKTYGELVRLNGTEFRITGGRLFFGDRVDRITMTSDGAAADAEVADSPYDIIGSPPVSGSGIGNYDITFGIGRLTIERAALTVIPDNQTKRAGERFVFNGTEFTTRGLLFEDEVERVELRSEGAAVAASPADSPFDIFASNAEGERLSNYDITYETGEFTVEAVNQPYIRPSTEREFALPNPPDTIVLSVAEGGTAGVSAGGTLAAARETLAEVQEISSILELAAAACSESSGNVDRYLACLSDALDDFANELDSISTDLPPGLQDVARIVGDARRSVGAARARARDRLAGATSDAEREQIRRDAAGEASAALNTAANEIRKAITLIRADDPELAAVQRATITTIAAAVDNVGIELSRATGL